MAPVEDGERTPLVSTTSARRRSRRRGVTSSAQNVSPPREAFGVFLVACSAFCFSVMALLVRMGAVLKEARFPSFQLVLSRSMFQFVAATAVLLSLRQNLLGPKDMRHWLLLRGLAGGLGIVCLFFSLSRLGLGECTVLVFTMPIFTIVFARIFLGEKLEAIDCVYGLICLCGIVLVARPHVIFRGPMPPSVRDRIVGACGALAAALCQASIYIIIKKMGASVHYMMNVQYLGIICTILSPIGGVVFKEKHWHLPQTMEEATVFFGVGLFGLLAQIFISRGLQLCRAGLGAIMTNLQILFSFVLGVVFLEEIPSATSVAGASIILASTLGVVFSKIFRRR